MKCVSCEIEINPKWTHAIDMNICPFCGAPILQENLKALLSTLRETMNSLKEYPDQVNDWMLSNHNYIKTDSEDICNYMPKEMLKEFKKIEDDKDFLKRKDANKSTIKIKTENGEEEVLVEKIQSEDKTNEFHKRAQNGPTKQQQGPNSYQSTTEKTEHLKKMAQQIKKAGSQGLTGSGESMMLSAEMLDQADPDAVLEFQQMISGGEIVSSLDSGIDDDLPGGDYILEANIAAAQGNSSGSGGNTNAKDLASLQRMQSKQTQAHRNISSGAKGSFSRS